MVTHVMKLRCLGVFNKPAVAIRTFMLAEGGYMSAKVARVRAELEALASALTL